MSKLDRFLDWLLPELICLSPMVAIAYYNAGAENGAGHRESVRAERIPLVSSPPIGAAVIPLARV
jgi:hypothetical protein